MLAGVCSQTGFFGQSRKLIELTGIKMSESYRHRGKPHDRSIAAGSVGTLAGSECILVSNVIAQCTSGGDADVEASPVYGILPAFPPINVTVGLVIQVPANRGDAIS